MGPTASGKTQLAEALAFRFGAQLVNADAFQVYRGMDIGTGKSPNKGLYRLLDLLEPTEQFGLGQWLKLAERELGAIWGRGQSAILVGGSGLYVRALMEGYGAVSDKPEPALRAELIAEAERFGAARLLDRLRSLDPEAAARVDASNQLRVRRALEKALSPGTRIEVSIPPFAKLKLGLDPPPGTLVTRIERRIDSMLAEGWLDEARGLLLRGIGPDAPGLKGIGYRQLCEVLAGRMSIEEAIQQIKIATRQYAKRQRTWLRKEPGLVALEWSDDPGKLFERAMAALEDRRS